MIMTESLLVILLFEKFNYLLIRNNQVKSNVSRLNLSKNLAYNLIHSEKQKTLDLSFIMNLEYVKK
jgi:hypothetical protein